MLCVTVRMRTCSIDTLMVLILSCDWLAIDCNWPQWWRGGPVSLLKCHDDVIKWKHFPCYWPFARGIHWSPVNSPHKGQWCRALMFSLICIWINSWVNNLEAGDLRCYWAHYDVTVMVCHSDSQWPFCQSQQGFYWKLSWYSLKQIWRHESIFLLYEVLAMKTTLWAVKCKEYSPT